MLAFSAAAINIRRKNTRSDEEVGLVEEKEGVVSVTLGLLFMIAGGSLIGGLIAGLLGLGGGFALAPLLLELGAHPQVCSFLLKIQKVQMFCAHVGFVMKY